jgi:hypothetical protein
VANDHDLGRVDEAWHLVFTQNHAGEGVDRRREHEQKERRRERAGYSSMVPILASYIIAP